MLVSIKVSDLGLGRNTSAVAVTVPPVTVMSAVISDTQEAMSSTVITVGMTVVDLAACVPVTTEDTGIDVVTVKATKSVSSVVNRTQAVRF